MRAPPEALIQHQSRTVEEVTVLEPTSLFAWEPHVDPRTLHVPTLVVTLGSYVDAGHTQRLVDAHLGEHLPNRVVGRFDADQVLDYAGRRPLITFERDHFSSYERPEIALRLFSDAEGRPFLLLSGPEPALQWERMAAAIAHVVEQADVRSTVLVQAIPSPAPHTRPVAITRFASDPELVADEVPVLGTFQLSAAFQGVLTVRLGEAGHPVTGLVAHVPHYIADNDYPAGAAAILAALREHAHLALPTEGLDLAAGIVHAQIQGQVEGNEELAEVVASLERAHDQFTQDRHARNAENAALPSADEIGDQVEEFLATLGADPDGRPDAGDAPHEPSPDRDGPEDPTDA